MTPYYSDAHVTLYCGDSLAVLRELPGESVQCVVTSPPYWGLRDYGTAKWEGGEAGCEHSVGGQVKQTRAPYEPGTGQRPGVDASYCRKCGARRIDSQLGLERTPEEYVGRMVEVFREVRRVLRGDGVMWVNLGDSYAGSGKGQGRDTSYAGPKQATNIGSVGLDPQPVPIGFKPKDLVGIPWRVAFALQADGWYLRSDVIWHKPNPMPESVTDRPTKAHEYVFLLTKQARYYYNINAVREPIVSVNDKRLTPEHYAAVVGTSWHDHSRDMEMGQSQGKRQAANPNGRNLRSVWTIPTQAYTEAHFATYPQELVRRCIAAGTRMGDTVLDPFSGSGTTAYVARSMQRRSIGIDLSPDYCKMAERRLQQTALELTPAQEGA